ncbi:MAG: hypothetical protein J6B71_07825, partial [Clostridia bacterium]|nr:hypothetical protein [Clostridia bacterium]
MKKLSESFWRVWEPFFQKGSHKKHENRQYLCGYEQTLFNHYKNNLVKAFEGVWGKLFSEKFPH